MATVEPEVLRLVVLRRRRPVFPVRDRTYNAGNYFYAAFAKQWTEGTRITFGGYDFTKNVVATANRAGGQFTFEQQLGRRLTLAAEWYTGNQADGYVDTGAVIKLSSKLTLYAAYQVGNAGVTMGNHQFLWKLGLQLQLTNFKFGQHSVHSLFLQESFSRKE